jgi:hypothetical protein
MVAETKFSVSMSIKHGSWFHGINLTLQEVLYLTYVILLSEPANQIQRGNHFSNHTNTDCGMFCREALLLYLEGSSKKLGGLTVQLRLMIASSVGVNTIGDTL